jgi:hypothetical protein
MRRTQVLFVLTSPKGDYVTARSDKTEKGQRCKKLVSEVSLWNYTLCHKHFAGKSRALTRIEMGALRKPPVVLLNVIADSPGS